VYVAGTAAADRWSGRPKQYGAKQQARRAAGGIAAVLLLHVVIWALLNGLATKVVQIVQKPVETRIIMPVKPPTPPTPPAQPVVKQPPPKIKRPPPFVPPPECVAAPPAPTIEHQAAPARQR
jgi:protein TonB